MHRKISTKLAHLKEETGGFVSSKFESLDFEYYDNEIILQEEERRGKIFMSSVFIQRVFLFVIIGFLTGICGALVELGVHHGSHLKYNHLGELFGLHFKSNNALLFFFWMLYVIIPGLFACLVVIYIEPNAAGGGVNWVLGYLNGVNLNNYNTYRNALVKMISNILCVIAGLPGGKEAPLIHVGSIIGSNTPNLGWRKHKPFIYFNHDSERRDMAAAGTAAGLTSAFACPIAGIMIAFEESLSFWHIEMTFLIFLSALSAYVTVVFIVKSVSFGCLECFATEQHLYLDVVKKSDMSFYILEMFIFMCMGAVGGILGASWNTLQKLLILFRKRHITTKMRRLLEILVVAFVNALVQIICIFSMSNYCVEKIEQAQDSHHDVPQFPKLGCKNVSEEPVMGILFFQTQLGELRSLFRTDESHLGILPLTIFGIYVFLGSCWLCGCYITHGIFVPHILIGATWGRLLAEIMHHIFPSWKSWARPNKFAFLCAAAQLSGSLHITFTISVMMLEISNTATLSSPVFIVVFFAKIFGNMINESIYHTQVCLSGIPTLYKEAPPLLHNMKVREVMNLTPLVTVPLRTNHFILWNIVLNYRHNGFPVVNPAAASKDGNLTTYGTLKGLILRNQLLIILKYQTTDDDLKDNKYLAQLCKEFLIASEIKEEELATTINPNLSINLEPFMNSSPYFINANASLSQAYRLFAGLGLRHLVVVNDSLLVVGIITRKDLSLYRHHDIGCHPESQILPIQ